MYVKTDLDVITVAILFGCKADHGLANTMNKLRRDGQIRDGMTYGEMVLAVCRYKLKELESKEAA